MPRFFVDRLAPPRVTLSPEESKHAARALRLDVGARVSVFDGAEAWSAEIEALGPPVVLRLLERLPRPALPKVVVAAAVPKGARLDWMIEKLAELGVAAFQPVRFARSVVEPGEGKLRRLEKIALAAAKQSGAPVMEIRGEIDVLALPADAVLADPDAAERLGPGPGTVVVGPEGGVTAEEAARFARRGSLGATILRVETAAVVAAARRLA